MIKNKKRRSVLIIIAVILAGFLSGSAAFAYFFFNSGGENTDLVDNNNNTVPEVNPGVTASLNKRVSFLLIGADKRPGDSSFNADSLIVASFDPDTKLISLLSVPRDTRITVSGSDDFVKINAVPMLRGINELQKVVADLTGVPLDGYVVTNFNGFKDIIDTLGGVTLYVEKDMYYETGDKSDGFINLKEGLQRLDGSQALQYARFRNDKTADIGRTARQQKVLTAVAKEVLQASTITKLPKLVPQLLDVVETNLKMADLLRLSKAAAAFDSSNIVTQTLPGYGLYLDHLSYWEVNRNTAKKVAQNLLMGITSDSVVDNTVLDLLDPMIKSHITVPGSSADPNGTDSSGHKDDPGDDPDQNQDPNVDPGSNPDPDVTADPDTDPGSEMDPGSDDDSNDSTNPDDGTTPEASTDSDSDAADTHSDTAHVRQQKPEVELIFE